ncbi:MAG: hypothetical protein WAO17_12725 [Candidatus Sulfotelmatobacter sp.]
MALFNECRERHAHIALDTADIVRDGDFATAIKMADNSAMADPYSDPPKTLDEAAEKFKKFLSAQHWPQTISWLTHDNVLVDGQGQFWVRERRMKAFEQSKLRYAEGVERNLGVALSAVCATDTETFASVFVPVDDLDGQYHLMGRVLKLSVPASRKSALTVRNPLRWWILGLRNKRHSKPSEL